MLISQGSESRWFAVTTAPRHEKRVAQRFSESDLDVFLAVKKVCRQWNKRPEIEVDLPLFPGYVFVRIGPGMRSRVLSTPGVHSIVGNRTQSLWIPDFEIEALRKGLHLHNPEPHPMIEVGERVLITGGALSGLEGILIRHKNSSRVVIAVKAIIQAVSVEIALRDITPIRSTREDLENPRRPETARLNRPETSPQHLDGGLKMLLG